MKRIAVLGGGNGGHAIAADLTCKGFNVRIFSRWPEEFKALRDRGGIDFTDPSGGRFVPFNRVCGRIEEVLDGAEVILFTVPAIAHDYYAEASAPYLKPDQIVVLNPGSTGGALAFRKRLKDVESTWNGPICETSTLTYICRLVGPAKVKVTSRSRVQFAALPGARTGECFQAFKELFPDAIEKRNVLETSLNNINAILHPPGMILNAGWIEYSRGNFSYYCEGTTPAVAKVIEAIDQERMALCQKLGTSSERFLDFFYKAGSTSDEAYRSGSVYRALQESEPNRFIRAPESLSYRFLSEDIPFGIVPMACLGRMLGIDTPIIDGLINLASLVNGTDYWKTGWTLEKMGIDGMGLEKLLDYVEHG